MTEYMERKHKWIKAMKVKWLEVFNKYATEEAINTYKSRWLRTVNFTFLLDWFSPIDSLTVDLDKKTAFIDTFFTNSRGNDKKLRIKII